MAWTPHCPTCGILVPDLERVRAENEALKKQLERFEVAAWPTTDGANPQVTEEEGDEGSRVRGVFAQDSLNSRAAYAGQ